MKLFFITSIFIFCLFNSVFPQSEHQSMPGMEMPQDTKASLVDQFLMQQGSGTSVNPSSSPMHMKMFQKNGWNLMFHNLFYLNYTDQSGDRGNTKWFSTNWFMGMADHPLGKGRIMFRGMLSLEPATVTDKSYP